ncbi:unnamed protein product [Rotaria magnacalcarata]|uniref:Elongation factor Ts, mitochondrial n=1 Tax=Rotaria magnacalcarata TaxID=392030 RepID=A0A816FI68_9BILA|nr:unnamed protein product [Rotaria magnacalcarata]
MSLELIKKLRDQTGAGMSDCQKAVKESDGTYDDAVRILREKGQQIASKKSSRAASEGLVGWIDTGNGILTVELNCETDFVSRGDKFQGALEKILSACKNSKATNNDSVLIAKIGEQSVKDFIAENIAIIGENIKLGRVHFAEYGDDLAGVYVHNALTEKPNLGVIVSVVTIKSAPKNDSAKEIARKVAMHVAASVPSSLSVANVDPKKVEDERNILKEQLKDSGKPEQVLNKIIEGKISKFFEDIVLLEQPSIFDNALKIKDWVVANSKEAGLQTEITSFVEVCLFEPDIAGNVGNMIRTCACFGIKTMHIILPASFPLDVKALKNSAMDYGKMIEVIKHNNFEEFKQFIGTKHIILLSTKASVKYFDFKYHSDDIIMVGSESRGVDAEIAEQINDKAVFMIIKVGTRSSKLALIQTNLVISKISEIFPSITFKIVEISTEGDKNVDKKALGDGGIKGMFTKEIDNQLISKNIDIAVHSMKDLASYLPKELEIIAVLEREDPRDCFVSKKYNKLSELPLNSVIGTSSIRRKLMLKNYRNDLNIVNFRGNILTRLEKLNIDDLDGIILAVSGLKRLNLESQIKQIIDTDVMMPAISQGVIGIVSLKENHNIANIFRQISHAITMSIIKTERSFAVGLNADCGTPLGCFTEITGNKITINGRFIDEKTNKIYNAIQTGFIGNEQIIGIDIVDLRRFEIVFIKHNTAFLNKFFTEKEILFGNNKINFFAGRFATKEAISKAFGCGFGKKLKWLDLEILSDNNGFYTKLSLNMDKLLFLNFCFFDAALYAAVKYFAKLSHHSTMEIISYGNVSCVLCLLPFALYNWERTKKGFIPNLRLFIAAPNSALKTVAVGSLSIKNVAMITYLQPAIVVFMSFIMLGEYDKKDNKQFIWLALSFVGIMIFVGFLDIRSQSIMYGLVFLHVLFKGLINVFTKQLSEDRSTTLFYSKLHYAIFNVAYLLFDDAMSIRQIIGLSIVIVSIILSHSGEFEMRRKMGSNVKKDNIARIRNKSVKSTVFTFYKKAVSKLSEAAASMKEVFEAIRKFESVAAKAARKNIIGQKSSSRKVSRLTLQAKKRFDQLSKVA